MLRPKLRVKTSGQPVANLVYEAGWSRTIPEQGPAHDPLESLAAKDECSASILLARLAIAEFALTLGW